MDSEILEELNNTLDKILGEKFSSPDKVIAASVMDVMWNIIQFSGERLAEVLANTTQEHEPLVVKVVGEFEHVLRVSLGELRSIKRNKAMN